MTHEIRDCIAPDRHPKQPDIKLPKGAIDTHVHVFEDKYRLSPDRGYNPPDATCKDLTQLHTALGFDRVVFTQPSAYGADNSAMIDGASMLNAETPGRAKMVVAVGADITEDQIAELNALGACGVRLNTDNKGGMPIELHELPELEAKLKPFNWHIEWLFSGKNILSLMPYFNKMTIPMSIGHFAYQPAITGVDAPGFKALIDLVQAGNTWVKISAANRVSETDLPPYDDVLPMAHALINANADRIMWGTDWPHPDKYEVNPNDGDLVNAFGEWVTDDAMRKRILVDTPESFYNFPKHA